MFATLVRKVEIIIIVTLLSSGKMVNEESFLISEVVKTMETVRKNSFASKIR